MSRRALLALLALAAFLAAAIPALASTRAPVVKSIRPLKVKVGQKLTIRGRNFLPGRHRDTVVFMGAGKRVVWVKADRATRTTIRLTLPSRLVPLLNTKSGVQRPTRLRIRVIARMSSRSFTRSSASPLVSAPATTPSVAEACPGVSNPAGDSDADGLSNGLEGSLGLDPCKADSDGDGVPDGYEYQAALDFNRDAGTSTVPTPYPGKRPYPNPLDPSDASTDHDGDGLTMMDEYHASLYKGFSNLSQIQYSDGDQTTGPVQSVASYPDVNPSYAQYADTNGDGVVQDDEKDADNDGLPNWDELYGHETQSWWNAWSSKHNEVPYPQTYGALDWLNPDTDGDGLVDGVDDQDHDGYANFEEISRDFATRYFRTHNAFGWDPANSLNDIVRSLVPATAVTAVVNPFNPCLPDPTEGSCMKHPPMDGAPSPFSGSPSSGGGPHQLEWPVQWPTS